MSITTDTPTVTTAHYAAVHHDMDVISAQLYALEVTAARLAAERDEARQAGLDLQLENCALTAAAFVLAADGIRREEELQAQLHTAAAEAETQFRVNLGLQGHLDDANRNSIRQVERIARLDNENRQLRTELADAETRAGGRERRWFPRRR